MLWLQVQAAWNCKPFVKLRVARVCKPWYLDPL
jgi:hypothetical protein